MSTNFSWVCFLCLKFLFLISNRIPNNSSSCRLASWIFMLKLFFSSFKRIRSIFWFALVSAFMTNASILVFNWSNVNNFQTFQLGNFFFHFYFGLTQLSLKILLHWKQIFPLNCTQSPFTILLSDFFQYFEFVLFVIEKREQVSTIK